MTAMQKIICEGPAGEGCGLEATVYVSLMTRVIPRCEKHKADFISTILGYTPINQEVGA